MPFQGDLKMWSASKQEMMEMERHAEMAMQRIEILRSAAIELRVAMIIGDDLRCSTIRVVRVMDDILEVEFTRYGVAEVEHYDISSGERKSVFHLAKAA